MNIIAKKRLWLVASLLLAAATIGCNPEPDATDLEFSYATFECAEGSENGYVSVYLMESPYKYPVVVDMSVEMTSGRNNLGEELTIDDVLTFEVTDTSYTVEQTSPRTAKIKGLEVTYTNYSSKVKFKSIDNDYLQNETITFTFKLDSVEGSEMGTTTSTVLTIVDDEKAPRVKSGYYLATYDSPADATNTQKGSFYLMLDKVGKYEYVASNWFGLQRPRLLGIYNPEDCTITFDGTDYDQQLWKLEAPVNAFENDTIWANKYESGKIVEILRMRGAGDDGKGAIVLSTEAIEENSNGVALSIDTTCGFDIYAFDAESNTATAAVGIYDRLEGIVPITFSKTNYPEESTRIIGTPSALPSPFSGWAIAE